LEVIAVKATTSQNLEIQIFKKFGSGLRNGSPPPNLENIHVPNHWLNGFRLGDEEVNFLFKISNSN
jgi:hypothetical protein